MVLGLVEIANASDTRPQRDQHFGNVFGIVLVNDVAFGDRFSDEGGDELDP